MPAATASDLAQVLGPDGTVLARAGAGSFAYPAGGYVIRVGAASVTRAGVELDDVALLGGQIRAARVIVPAGGRTSHVVDLVVAGRTAPTAENGLIPLGGADYLVTAQTAVSTGGSVGRVGLRLTLGDNAYGVAAGTQILVGLPARPRAKAGPVRRAADPLAVLGFTGEIASTPAPALVSFLPAEASLGARAVSISEQYLGVRYRWGGADPASGFDCSGLVQYVYRQLGIQLTHYTGTQFYEGAPVPREQLEPGDLVFFEPSDRGPQHVGIYVGGDEFVHAPHTGDVVRISSLSSPQYGLGFVGAVRPSAG